MVVLWRLRGTGSCDLFSFRILMTGTVPVCTFKLGTPFLTRFTDDTRPFRAHREQSVTQQL